MYMNALPQKDRLLPSVDSLLKKAN
jgi:hypothetical protein